MSIGFCPRCGEKSFESLKTHSFCINCNYDPEELERDKSNIQDFLTPELKKDLAQWSRALQAVM